MPEWWKVITRAIGDQSTFFFFCFGLEDEGGVNRKGIDPGRILCNFPEISVIETNILIQNGITLIATIFILCFETETVFDTSILPLSSNSIFSSAYFWAFRSYLKWQRSVFLSLPGGSQWHNSVTCHGFSDVSFQLVLGWPASHRWPQGDSYSYTWEEKWIGIEYV